MLAHIRRPFKLKISFLSRARLVQSKPTRVYITTTPRSLRGLRLTESWPKSIVGGFSLQAPEHGENVTTMHFDGPKATMAIISNPLRSTRKSAQTDVTSQGQK
jgi:hypothetical protein